MRVITPQFCPSRPPFSPPLPTPPLPPLLLAHTFTSYTCPPHLRPGETVLRCSGRSRLRGSRRLLVEDRVPVQSDTSRPELPPVADPIFLMLAVKAVIKNT